MQATGGRIQNPPVFNEHNTYRDGGVMTAASNSGPFVDRDTGRTYTKKEFFEALQPFFGPQKEPPQRPYADYPVENKDLPDAFIGSNAYMRKILIDMITQDDMFPVLRMFPWVKHESSMKFSWTISKFDSAMMGRTPEEGTSRLLTQRSEEHSASLIRQGIALILEHGFFETAQGRENWAMHLRQIGNAVVETAAFGAIVAALTNSDYTDENEKWRDTDVRSVADLEALFRDELSQWAGLQKADTGFEMVASRADAIMSDRGVDNANVWYWPKGTAKYAQNSVQETLFLLSGRKSGEQRDVMKETMSGAAYTESRGFRMSAQSARYDPVFREQTIGTFFTMDDAGVRSVDPKEYRTVMMDRVVYNENRDSMETISFAEWIKYAGLFVDFEEGSGELSDLGHEFFGGARNWLDFIKSADTNDYCLDTLLAKGVGDHIDLVTNVAGQSFVTLSGIAPSQPRQGQPLGMLSGKSKLKDDINSLVHTAIDSTQWSDRAKQNAHEFSDFLGKLPDQNKSMARRFHQAVQANASSRLESSHNFNWGTMGKHLLDNDRLTSLSVLHTDGALELTQLEEKYTEVRRRMHSASEKEQKQLKLEVHEADRQSPAWKPVAGKKPFLELRVTPYQSAARYCPLAFQSFSFTFASTNLVLFHVTDESLKALAEREGVADFDLEGVSRNDPIRNAVERFALLQFSVSLSAIFTLIEKFVQEVTDKTFDASKKQLLEQVTKVLTRIDPITGQSAVMAAASEQAEQFGTLSCQKFAEAQIKAVASLLHTFYANPRMSASDLDSYVQDVAESLQALNDDVLEQAYSSRRMQGRSGAQFVINAELPKLIKTFSPDLAESTVQSKINEADAKIKALNTELFANPKQRDSGYSVLYKYHTLFKTIWLLLDNSNNTLVPDTEKDKTLTTVAQLAQQLSRERETKELVKPGELARQYLVEVVQALKRRQLPQNQNGPLKLWEDPSSIQSNKPLLLYLQGQLLSLSANLQLKTEAALKSMRIGSRALFYTQAVVWESLKDAPEDITDLRQLWTRASSELNLDVMFAAAVALYWKGQIDQDFKNKRVEERVAELKLAPQYHPVVAAQLLGIENGTPAARGTVDPSVQADFDATVALVQGTAAKSIPDDKTPAATKLSKFALEAVLKALPIDGRFVKWCLRRNVYLPIQLICFRPHATYEMGTAINMVGGGEGGQTYYGFADFQLADNVIQKMHYGHYTHYMKTIVRDKSKIMLLRNILCRNYVRGNGLRPWDPLSDADRDAYTSNELMSDVFVVAEKANWKSPGNVMDLTGKFSPELGLNNRAAETGNYTMARVLVDHWCWQNKKQYFNAAYGSRANEGRHNTLCFQAYNRYYNHATKEYSSVIGERGHWAGCVYEGCGKVRRMHAKQFNDPQTQPGFPRITLSS